MAQIHIENKLKGRKCPGEEKCSETSGMPLARDPDGDIEAICDRCELVGTKPGSQPRHLAHWINVALEFDAVPERSACTYPEVLNCYEWTAVKALEVARYEVRASEHRQREQEQEKEAKRKAEEQRLRALINRR